jgi:hypothetical protein
MTTSPPVETTTASKLAQRSRIRAFRVGRYVLIVAEGDLPNPGYEVDIELSPIDIFPPQYDLLRRQRPGFWPQVIVPYRYGEVVLFPADQPTVTVQHADGLDEVEIQGYGDDLAELAAVLGDRTEAVNSSEAGEVTGMSGRLSFDEAFADAIAQLRPSFPDHPDALSRVEVAEIGGLFGGIAGFHHLFVRVRHVGS